MPIRLDYILIFVSELPLVTLICSAKNVVWGQWLLCFLPVQILWRAAGRPALPGVVPQSQGSRSRMITSDGDHLWWETRPPPSPPPPSGHRSQHPAAPEAPPKVTFHPRCETVSRFQVSTHTQLLTRNYLFFFCIIILLIIYESD